MKRRWEKQPWGGLVPPTLLFLFIFVPCTSPFPSTRTFNAIFNLHHPSSLPPPAPPPPPPSSSTTLACQDTSVSWTPYKVDYTYITDEQWQQLDDLASLMTDWNIKVNLVSRKDIDALIPTHIAPCLAINLFFEDIGCVFPGGSRVIDVGTGGGLPGLPLAICNPTSHFTLLDSNGKKMMVVEDIMTKLKLNNVKVVKARAEDIQTEKFDYMLGRSVSAVPTFLGFSSHFIDDTSDAIRSGLLYIKGGDFTEELKTAQIVEYDILAIRNLTKLDTDKNLLHIPSIEICNFHRRKVELHEEEKLNKKNNKKQKHRYRRRK